MNKITSPRWSTTRKRLLFFNPILLVSVPVVATCISFFLLYRTSFEQYKARLVDAVDTQAKLVKSLAELNNGDAEKTLEQLADVQEHHRGIGETGECVLAVLEGDTIRFLPHHRQHRHPTPASLAVDRPEAEPIRKALKKQTGTLVGLDYRGETVLAAYRPIPALDWGAVAKVNLNEIRAPFVHAALAVLCAVGLLVGGGTALLLYIDKPVLAELEQSEKKHRALVETISDFIWEVDQDNVFTYASPQVEDLLGYGSEDFVGKRPFDFMSPDEADRIRRLAQDVIQPGQPFVRMEVTHLRKDGRQVVVEISGVPVVDERGEHLGYRGISRDITQRKEADRAIRRERQNLKRMLELNDRDRQLIAYEIHDGLAQHLSAALMHFQVFQQTQQQDPDQAWRSFSHGMQLLGEGHSEARSLISGLRPPILDESGIVAAIEHLVNDTNEAAGPKIEFHGNVKFKRLASALENALFRIAQESLTNACRHSESEKVRIELTQRDDSLRIEVQDWGVGFDPRNVKQGTFGLAGIRERARLLGGHATVDSTRGKGTRIVVELPFVESSASAC